MMYKLVYLPVAKKDMEKIIYYISRDLKNNKAALDLTHEFNKQMQNILNFPYGSSVYHIIKSLKYEYRKILVKNFQIFYIIDKETKIITISRVLYNKRDIVNLLK